MPGQRIPEHERREQILNAALQVAMRDGIGSVTVRAVAAQAGSSHALVLFHFKKRETLVRSLLASVLSTVVAAPVVPEGWDAPTALARLRALLRGEVARLGAEPGRVRLLLDSWALGARHPGLREQVREAWAEYGRAVRQEVERAISEEGPLAAGVTIDGITALTVAIVSQSVVQGVIDPEGFPRSEYAVTADTALERLFVAGA
ncbi:MAG TPA: TetR/AcrR family transcriptional regulator [Longimicrobiales bacterium]